jgi:quercetin dioxygenase-like cupin family protein
MRQAAAALRRRGNEEQPMPDDVRTATQKPATKVAYASEKKPVMVAGRRDFFAYRDLGLKEASAGQMRGQVMKAITGMTQPTGWHYHTCDGQFVYALKGWVELEFATGETLRVEAGDSVFIPGGMPHNELRTSDDVEILEVSVPGELGTVPCDPPVSPR